VPFEAWRLKPLCSLHWRQFGDAWAVFDEGSGDTYCMDTVSAVALMCLAESSCSLADLTAQVAIETDLPAGEELSNALASVLETYAGEGLIEPAAS
jgi:PqqD family protein of HPr-rel-A system